MAKRLTGYKGLIVAIFGDENLASAKFSRMQKKQLAKICDMLIRGIEVNRRNARYNLRAADLIRRRFGIGVKHTTQQVIADFYNVDKNRVSQIEKKSLRWMKDSQENRELRELLVNAGFSNYAPAPMSTPIFNEFRIRVQEGHPLSIDELAQIKLDELELSAQSMRCFRKANIRTVADLVGKSRGDLLRVPNFGLKSLKEIVDAIAPFGVKIID